MNSQRLSWKLRATLLALTVALSGPHSAHAEGGVPYTDGNSKGTIGLCDKAGKSIRSGAVGDKPFAWTAVSSVPAPAPYNGAARTATLLAYQPRPGVDPGDWSGSLITASSKYTNTAHPMAQATDDDWALADFLSLYPPMWDGLIQLRIYLGMPDQPVLQHEYAATDLKITGDRWEVVRGKDVPCNSGKAISLETLLLPPDFFSPGPTPSPATTASPGQSASPGGDPGSAGASMGGGPTTNGGASPPGGSPAAAGKPANPTGSSGARGAAAAVAAVGILGLVGGGLLLMRLRRHHAEQPPSS
jgi:hypothetical protein